MLIELQVAVGTDSISDETLAGICAWLHADIKGFKRSLYPGYDGQSIVSRKITLDSWLTTGRLRERLEGMMTTQVILCYRFLELPTKLIVRQDGNYTGLYFPLTNYILVQGDISVLQSGITSEGRTSWFHRVDGVWREFGEYSTLTIGTHESSLVGGWA